MSVAYSPLDRRALHEHSGLRQVAAGVSGHRSLQCQQHGGTRVVTQMSTDGRQRVLHADAVRLQRSRITDPRQHQQLRRVDRAGAHQDLVHGVDASRLHAVEDVDADRAVTVEHDAQCPRLGDHLQIGSGHRRSQVGGRGTAAHAVADRQVVQAGTVAALAVEVGVAAVSAGHGGIDECVRDRVRCRRRGHRERPSRSVQGRGAEHMVLGADEVGQHVAPAPARVAQVAPVVEVVRVAADDDHGVDGARSAQALAALAEDAAQRVAALHGRRVAPVLLAVPEQRPLAGLAHHAGVAVSAGLDQRHPAGRVFRQASGQHAAGGTGTDDHDVRAIGHEPLRGGVARYRCSRCAPVQHIGHSGPAMGKSGWQARSPASSTLMTAYRHRDRMPGWQDATRSSRWGCRNARRKVDAPQCLGLWHDWGATPAQWPGRWHPILKIDPSQIRAMTSRVSGFPRVDCADALRSLVA